MDDDRHFDTVIDSAEREGRWVANAVREDTGDPFGVECAGASAREAVERLTRWLEWQSEHTAFECSAARRAGVPPEIAGGAFANSAEGPTVEMQRDALEAVEATRIRLDAIRARKPEA